MKKTLVSAMISLFVLPVTSSFAEDIYYDGSNPGMLRPDPVYPPPTTLIQSLYPQSSLTGNIVTVNTPNNMNQAFIYGGVSLGANDVTGNTVTINNGSNITSVYGGYSKQGNANGNTVTINGGTLIESVFGGYSFFGQETNNNTVTINGGTIGNIIPSDVFGAFGQSSVISGNNTVTINGGMITGGVYGDKSNNAGDSIGNNVTINGGTIDGNVYGAYRPFGNVIGNTVTINGGTVNGHIYVAIGSGPDSRGNTVNLFGGNVTGYVIGDNSLNGDNTLNVTSRFTLRGLVDFDNLNFTLPADAQLNDPLITAGTVQLGGTSTVKSINVASGNSAIKVGDTVTLLSSTNTPIDGALSANTAQGKKGLSLIYDWEDVRINNTAGSGTLTARLAGETVNPDSQKLLLGRVVELALLKQGGDLLAGQAIENMVHSAQNGDMGFFAMQGGDSHYRTDPRFSMDSFTLMAGATRGSKLRSGTLVSGGVFVEAGTGHYSNSHDVTDLSPINVHGNAHYFGAGLMGDIRTPDGYEFDAAFRIGQVTGDLITNYYSGNQRASFDDTSALYMGAHVNAAYKWQISREDMLNAYARYSWTHMARDNVTVLDDVYHFDSANSHRLRVGTKYAKTSGAFMPYAGVAYEYEFDGKAGGHVYGHRMADIDLGGSTVVAEVGVSWLPTNKHNLKMNVALEGFAGKREGVMGSMRLNYKF